MSTPEPVRLFYESVWNAGDLDAADDLLSGDCTFRGSLGNELRGREAFKEYVRSVRTSLSGYRCEILACVTEGDAAFARMRFSGLHMGTFRGHAPTGKQVSWEGAAFFRFVGGIIRDIWVLGDLEELEKTLRRNKET